MEKRFLQTTELRAAKCGEKMVVRGYAARYGVLSHPIPVKSGQSFRELIERGAFDSVLAKNPDVVATFNHDVNQVLGRTTAGTLRLCADDKGLAFECDLPNTTAGRDVWESVQRGDLNSCSFAFGLGERMDSFDEEDVDDDEDESLRGKVARKVKQIVRRIRSFAKLFDISIVTSPAYPGTSVAARNLVSAEVRSRVNDVFKRTAFIKPTAEVKLPEVDTQAAELDETIARRRRDVLKLL
jgi:HK97 family phage prohead protease